MIEIYLQLFFQHQIQIKMIHFQTNGFGTHKATDKYLGIFQDNFDKFCEVAQGKFGKFDLNKLEFNVSIVTDMESIENVLKNYVKILNKLDEYDGGNVNDLINIKESMVADANQLLYLLTFN